jgi:hypothetical protein
MKIKAKQISSLEKIFKKNEKQPAEILSAKVLRGERFSYQVEITCDKPTAASISVKSDLDADIQLYREREVYCDMPSFISHDVNAVDDNYLTDEPTVIPDALEPLEDSNGRVRITPKPCIIWLRADIAEKCKPGKYDIEIKISVSDEETESVHMTLDVADHVLPKPDLKYTQWFYCDCIAAYYNAEIYSERHWELIESFIKTAADCGINMLLTPVHNPPLDTAVGHQRPNVQLAKITFDGEQYSFDFSRLERWVSLCLKYGIKYFEMPHFFSQWGLKYAPNIYVNDSHMFGSFVKSDSEEYVGFLRQYLPALIDKLKELGIYENTYFHVSDEPTGDHLEAYKRCRDLLTDIAGELNFIDALSEVEFYKNGLITTPIPASNFIEPFLNEDIKERWIYYCCAQGKDVSNRFIAMSSYRNRIMGVQMYKFGIKGFLQWGYNFYFAQVSEYAINPYLTTSADGAFPSGDAFSVYPGSNGALLSMRALIFYEGLQDMALCKLLEEKTSREFVVNLIDEIAGKDVRFASMPEDEDYIYKLRGRILELL